MSRGRPALVHSTAELEEKRQFVALYRIFLFRVIDLELLSASGDVRNLLAQLAAILFAYSFVVPILAIAPLALMVVDHSELIVIAWGPEEFFFSTTITSIGLFSLLSWDTFLSNRRDSFVLNPLPVRTRTVLAAKSASLLTAFGISILAVNIVTGVIFPFMIVAGHGTLAALRCFLSYWSTIVAAGLFSAGCVFAIQGVAGAVLSYRNFQRISGLLQLLAMCGVLVLFFLTPPLATPSGLSSPANQHLLLFLPSFWFLGLFQELNGTSHQFFAPLASRAIWSLFATYSIAITTAALSYRRNTNSAIEQSEIAPERCKGPMSQLLSASVTCIFRDPIDHAILLFSARTLARSRQHRLILAVYLGVALAISLGYIKSLVYGTSGAPWEQPSAPLLITGLVTLFIVVVGSRAAFALPFVLEANWILRVTAVRRPASYFSAVRKMLFSVAALPVLLLCAIAYLAIWPWRPAFQHLLVLLLISALLVQVLLRKSRKIPFACSYLPGKSNLGVRLGIAVLIFLRAIDLVGNVEHWSMQKSSRYVLLVILLAAATAWATRRTAALSAAPHNSIQFEDVPEDDILTLDLRHDSAVPNDDD